ncbi:adhesin transport system membrane fusion protein [Chromohalobacter marismortui]|uniref:Membrane fusion protein (MFP) family protein n=1 Tax=Chromohalobacter marismortui TaxID=42055 RepID=A0A4R7NLZ5_9GAMM|nr:MULTISPECIES: HlyD family type I secretion periplasmic adaptor subunit [Chromohalobacter]MCI0510104.1 HlyD family type I secretion periplasmic adaptor subunit [Chromohalobacter sp.]MCI0594815.1 HlyD family type I secretion periplasmic adaptor subunit [Chromohalobacter sp.]TDU21519.1 adhesin transport system membrane fusion protein [Chromohalobacter marismortui]
MAKKRKSAEQQGFEALGRFSEKGGKPFRPFMDRLFSKRVTSAHLNRDWASDADWARMQQDPLRARALLYGIFLAVVALLVWASFAEINEVTHGQGRVIPAQKLQRVQSLDGGMVEKILVQEGQNVAKGEVIMQIDPTRFVSDFRKNKVQAQALKARAEGLRSLLTDTPFSPSEELLADAPLAVSQERKVYESRLNELNQQKAVIRDRIRQREAELREARLRRDTASRELKMANEELQLTRPLLSSGAVSEVEVLRLEREVSRNRGERDQASAAIEGLEAAVEQSKSQLRELDAERRSKWRKDLAETLSEIAALNEASVGLKDRVQLADIRSPVKGVVQQLYINTVGGVIQPGEKVVDIIPTDDRLLVEARVAPRDIAFLSPGQDAIVKLTAYDYAVYGGLEAELESISADTITDDDDNTFYRVRVRTERGEINNEKMDIIPGMTAQVDIMTGKRTVMEFLLKPVLRAWNNSLGER